MSIDFPKGPRALVSATSAFLKVVGRAAKTLAINTAAVAVLGTMVLAVAASPFVGPAVAEHLGASDTVQAISSFAGIAAATPILKFLLDLPSKAHAPEEPSRQMQSGQKRPQP
jgi:hypothetical protein